MKKFSNRRWIATAVQLFRLICARRPAKKSVNFKLVLPPLTGTTGYARLLSAWGGEMPV